MAVVQSDWMQSGKPALGGIDASVIASITSVSVPSTAAVNDVIEICPTGVGMKAIRIVIEDPSGIYYDNVNNQNVTIGALQVRNPDGSTATLVSAIQAGVTELYGKDIGVLDGVLQITLANAPNAAGTLNFVVEATYA